MVWHVVTKEADGIEGRSSAMSSEVSALSFACDLLASGVEVLRVDAPDGGMIDAAAIAVWCGGRRGSRLP